MEANAIDLTTLENVKQWLTITSTDDDELLQRMVTAISAFIQSYINRTIARATYTETQDGNGKSRIMCSNYPVLSVSAVACNTWQLAPSPNGYSVGYYFDQYYVGIRGGTFHKGEANVVITYEAGYDTTPFDLEQACIETVGLRYKERDRIGYVSKSLAGETVSFSLADFSKSSQTMLNNYKKVISQ